MPQVVVFYVRKVGLTTEAKRRRDGDAGWDLGPFCFDIDIDIDIETGREKTPPEEGLEAPSVPYVALILKVLFFEQDSWQQDSARRDERR